MAFEMWVQFDGIPGATRKGHKQDGQTKVFAASSVLTAAWDAGKNSLQGERIHLPCVLLCEFDKAGPVLLQKAFELTDDKKKIATVTISHYGNGTNSAATLIVKLTDVRVCATSYYLPDTQATLDSKGNTVTATQNQVTMIQVALTYGQYDVTYNHPGNQSVAKGNSVATDTWGNSAA